MPVAGVYALTAAVCLYLILARLERALGLLVLVTVLVPQMILVPQGVSGHLTIGRELLLAMLVGLVLRARRRELAPDAFRFTPVHVAFLAVLLVSVLVGMGAAPPSRGAGGIGLFLRFLDQALFFVAVLASVRSIPDEDRVASMVAGVIVIAALIGVFEHFTHRAWSKLVFEDLPGRFELALRRGGQVRVRAGSMFALEFAWVCVMLLPILLAVAARARRFALVWIPAIGAVIAATVFTFARSAILGTVLVLVLAWAAVPRQRRIASIAAAVVAAGAIVYIASPSLVSPFSSEEAQGSSQYRTERLPVVFDLTRDRPFLGLGPGGLRVFGVRNFDSTYLGTYAETGAVGLAFVAALLGVAVLAVGRGLRAPPSQRLLPAAAFAGALAGLAAAGAYDLFSLPGSPKIFWLLVALGIGYAERRLGPQTVMRRLGARRLALVASATVLGAGVALAAPVHAEVVYRFQTVPVRWEARAPRIPTNTGTILAGTVCGVAEAVRDPTLAAVKVECAQDFQRLTVGFGTIRLEGPTYEEVALAAERLRELVRGHVRTLRTFTEDGVRFGRPTWARTAPVWLGVGALAVALFAPAPRRRRGPPAFRLRTGIRTA